MEPTNLTGHRIWVLLVSCFAIASLAGCGISQETTVSENSKETLDQLEISLPGTVKTFPTTNRGGLVTNAEITSGDGRISLSIAEGTIFLDKDGKAASSIRLQANPTPPPQSGDSAAAGTTYSFTPAGITCSHPINITMSYLPDIIPSGIDKNGIFIASYEKGIWEPLSNKRIDMGKYLVTTQIDHFSMYAVLVCLPTSVVAASTPKIATAPTSIATTPGVNTSSTAPVAGAVDRVEMLYFHSNQRCKTCLYFEERTRYVLDTFFKSEMQSGMLSLRLVNRDDKANSSLVQKYKVVGSQLFINTIINGTERSRNVWEIYSWGTSDSAFDAGLKPMIQKSLKGELQ